MLVVKVKTTFDNRRLVGGTVALVSAMVSREDAELDSLSAFRTNPIV